MLVVEGIWMRCGWEGGWEGRVVRSVSWCGVLTDETVWMVETMSMSLGKSCKRAAKSAFNPHQGSVIEAGTKGTGCAGAEIGRDNKSERVGKCGDGECTTVWVGSQARCVVTVVLKVVEDTSEAEIISNDRGTRDMMV